MKPISVRFQCFGPYMDVQEVDFTRLDKLFLINGETGAGKTTLLDAICFALFNESCSGERGTLSTMRCKLAGDGDVTLVEFVFENNGSRYKFVRSLTPKTKNIADDHNCFVMRDGEYVQLLDNPKQTYVTAEAERIIGLSAEQFRQVIMLPQGKFEEFLTAPSDEKEKTLVKIFNADKWQRIADAVNESVRRREAALNNIRAQFVTRLADFECSSLSELSEKASLQNDAVCSLSAALEEASAAEKKKIEENSVLIALNAEFEALDERKKTYDKLNAQSSKIELESKNLSLSDEADTVSAVYDAFVRAKDSFGVCCDDAESAEKECQVKQIACDKASAFKKEHEQGKAEYDVWVNRLAVYRNSLESYRQISERYEKYRDASDRLNVLTAKHSSCETLKKNAEEALAEARARISAVMEEYQTATAVYREGICGALASDLTEGTPCPVCGSVHHPAPAVFDGETVSEEDIKEINKRLDSGRADENKKLSDLNEAVSALADAEKLLKKASSECEKFRAEYESALNSRIEGIDTLEDLETSIESLSSSITEYDGMTAAVADAYQAASQALEVAKSKSADCEKRLDEAREALEGASGKWSEVLASSSFDSEAQFIASRMQPDEKAVLRDRISDFRGSLKSAFEELGKQEKKLSGKERPDMEKASAELEEVRSAKAEAQSSFTLASKLLDDMNGTITDLEVKMQTYEAERTALDADQEFSKRLRGERGISLQRYVLGVMLQLIAQEANRLLDNAYGGRYQLKLSRESSGRAQKKGLDLEVLDRENNEYRSVSTLSGGEKFIVSLSLALGLSMVVQSQGTGVRMQGLFVDEGFGSLDHTALGDVIDMLKIVQGGDGIVGIISHVDDLAGSIPDQIEAVKGKHGSRLKLPY